MKELAQGWKDDPDTLPILKTRALEDANRVVRSVIVQELARGWKDEPWIFEFLHDRAENDPDEKVREFANKKLAELEKEN